MNSLSRIFMFNIFISFALSMVIVLASGGVLLIVWGVVLIAGFAYVLHKIDAKDTLLSAQKQKTKAENEELKERLDWLDEQIEKFTLESAKEESL